MDHSNTIIYRAPNTVMYHLRARARKNITSTTICIKDGTHSCKEIPHSFGRNILTQIVVRTNLNLKPIILRTIRQKTSEENMIHIWGSSFTRLPNPAYLKKIEKYKFHQGNQV